MVCSGFVRALRLIVFAAALLALLPVCTSAQQVTFYNFNTPATASPQQYSYACSTSSPSSNPLFCFNYQGSYQDPSFLQDPVSTNYLTQLTYAQESQAASMWFSVPQVVSGGFNTWFEFRINPVSINLSSTADGLAFVIQNASGGAAADPASGCNEIGSGPTVVGGGGGCIGYGGIDNSLALEFDTFWNSPWDPEQSTNDTSYDDNHISLQDCGAGTANSPAHYPSDSGPACQVYLAGPDNTQIPTLIQNPTTSAAPPAAATPVTVADGNIHQVVIVYNGPNDSPANYLYVYLDPTFDPGTVTPVAGSIPLFSGPYDITQALNLLNSGTANGSAYVGFTSATGGSFEQHELLGWTFTPHTPVTEQQPLQPAGSPTYTQFPFGTHTYAVQYPSNGPSTTGVSMTVTANTVSPALFAQLINGTPFQGSACQVYDDTGGNCVIYSVSCSVTGSNPPQIVACPAASVTDCAGDDASSCINVKTTYNNSSTPVSPGFLQGDPFYSQISSLSVSGDTATFTCTGECSVTNGQTVSVVGAQPTTFNGTYTVTSASPSTPNTFTAQTSVSASGSPTTAGFLTSSNVQNIFVSWVPQNIDGTSTGRTTNFSDFVFTSQTNNAGTQTQLSANPTTPTVGVADVLTATVTGAATQVASPTGNVLFYAGNTLICTSPVNTVAGITTASCSYTPTDASPVTLSAQYQGDTAHFLSNSNQLSFTPIAGTPSVTFVPTPSSQVYGTPVSATTLDGTASYNSTPLQPSDGTISYSTTINGVPNQPVVAGVTVLPVGAYTITATFTPSGANYTTASTPASYSVTQATPGVTWPSATPITYGQTLASSTLTGGTSPSVVGVFSFTTPTLAPLAGLQSESVTFTPKDSIDYSILTQSITVQVNRAPTRISSLPSATPILYGQTLASSTLSGGLAVSTITGAPVTGGFAFANLTSAPTASGSQNVTFTPFDTNNYVGTTGLVAVTVTPSPVIGISPSNINFGTLYLGNIKLATVTITNSGNAVMTLSDPLISIVKGGDSSEFIAINLCPRSLAAGKSCTMVITFIAGPFYNAQTATLTIKDNVLGSPQTIPLSATVIDPIASFSPSSLSFGTVKTTTGASTKSIAVTSAGGTALTITGVSVSGADAKDFAPTTTCSAALNPKAACSISVTFKPSAKGTRTAVVTVIDNEASSPRTISLSGTGD